METKQNRPKDISAQVLLFGGSSVKQITVSLKLLCSQAGIKFRKIYHPLNFDWNQNHSSITNNNEELIGNDEFFRAAMDSTPEVLADAEKNGRLWSAPGDFYKKPGSAFDNKGAGGKPQVGYTIAGLNAEKLIPMMQKLMQATQDYALLNGITKEGDRALQSGRLPISILISTVGAMGTGSLYWFLNEGIPLSAQQTNIMPKVTVHLILRGNLSTQNQQAARLNESITLKDLRAKASGKYVNPIASKITPAPFTNCCLYSNVNEHGNFTNLPQLLYHQAHAEFFLWSTPAGNLMQERACDIEGITYDNYGDPLCGQTFSVGMLTRNSRRVIEFCKFMAVSLFCMRLTIAQENQRHIDEAVALARNEHILETEQDNLLTSDIIRPEELGRENVAHQCHESIQNRIQDSRGFQKGLQLDEAIADALNNDIPSYYGSAMQKQAQQRYEAVCETVVNHIRTNLRSAAGLTYSLGMLSALRQIVTETRNVLLQDKIPESEGYLMPHQMVIAEASEHITQLQLRSAFTRWTSFFLIRRIISELQESGLAAVTHQLDISCCQIADRDLLTPLLEFLDRKIGWLASTLQKIQNIAQTCSIQARRLAAEDTTALNPNGIELTSPEYLTQFFKDYLSNQGGIDQVCKTLQGHFIKKYESMEVFLETPQEELQEMLFQLTKPTFEIIVKGTNVWDEFYNIYQDSHTRQEMFTQIIQHSEGRVITEDCVGQSIVWIKTVNVPDASLVEPIRKMLESLDKKPGKWEVAVHDDIDTISIGQLRGAISLSPFIRRLNIPDNEIGWKALADHAIDIVSALTIPPNPNLHQFKRVLVKAVAADLITVADGLLYLQQPDTEPLSLGSDFDSAKNILIEKWPEMVFIESAYAHELIVDEKRVLQRLDSIRQSPDIRSDLFDKKAIEECLCQTQIMLPRLRRMRVAAMREQQL